ncbi:hypothetical protein M422DRAFT_248697 [Sphaerobolus stellatus SS14]|nr:hypothetical protein M422DRAFT_248697 [Sphaerobolus stellatus SS14]
MRTASQTTRMDSKVSEPAVPVPDLILSKPTSAIDEASVTRPKSSHSKPRTRPNPIGKRGMQSLTQQRLAAGWQQITSQLWVKNIVIKDSLPDNWDVPESPDYPVAYKIDLSASSVEHKDEKGNVLSMSAIIKNAV